MLFVETNNVVITIRNPISNISFSKKIIHHDKIFKLNNILMPQLNPSTGSYRQTIQIYDHDKIMSQ